MCLPRIVLSKGEMTLKNYELEFEIMKVKMLSFNLWKPCRAFYKFQKFWCVSTSLDNSTIDDCFTNHHGGGGFMWLNGELQSADHVFVWRFQFVEKHFLVEHLGEGAAHRRHYPDPVRGAPSPRLLLVLHVLHERLGGRVVVRDGHAHLLKKR